MRNSDLSDTKPLKKSSKKWKGLLLTISIQFFLLMFGIFFGIRLNETLQGKTGWLDVILLFLAFISTLGGFYWIERHVKMKRLQKMNDETKEIVDDESNSNRKSSRLFE